MSYQNSRQWVVDNNNNPMDGSKCEHQETLPDHATPKVVWVPMLVPVEAVFPYWVYPQTFYDYDLNVQANMWPAPLTSTKSSGGNAQAADHDDVPAAQCSTASADQSDSLSDASTDVGEGDDIAEDFEEESPKQVDRIEAHERPSMFAKLSREQRVDQLRRVIDEYCALEFDSVDSTSQGGLACRMLAILKSLSDSTTFHGEQGCTRERRLVLLGLDQNDEDAITNVVGRAQSLCEERSFRKAFAVLKEVIPRFGGKAAPALSEVSSEDIEAMKLRRLEKRQRQRNERRVQRADDRADRSAQRCPSVSSGPGASCKPTAGPSNKSRK